MGDGIYFALNVFEALRFRATSHGHTYTHLVEVDVPFAQAQFCDLRQNPNAIVKSQFASIQHVKDRHLAFCEHHNIVGIIWQSMGQNNWTEAVVLRKHIGTGFTIIESAPV